MQLLDAGQPRYDPALLEDEPGRERKVALVLGAAFFVGFLGWAAVTPLDAGAYAHGVVAVSGNRKAVQHRDGGIVTSLRVKDGDRVLKGQMLLGIGSSDIEAEERGLTSEYLMLLAERARLMAEGRGQAVVATPREFASLSPADRILADEALEAQRSLLRARSATARAQKSVLGEQAQQAGARIGGIKAEHEANRKQRVLIEQQLDGMRELAAKGFASLNKVRELERLAAALDGQAGSNESRVAETRGVISQVGMQAAVIDRNIIEEVDTRMREITQRINEIRPRLAAARERLAHSIVRAPETGRVVGLKVFTVGGVVAPGQTLMEVVPDDRELVIKAQLSPNDADDVAPGLATKVRFPTLHDQNLPSIDGVIETVSADSLTDEKTGVSYFSAQVRVPAAELRELSADRPGRPPIQSGLPVEILVPLQKRTLLQYLLEPLMRSMWQTGREH